MIMGAQRGSVRFDIEVPDGYKLEEILEGDVLVGVRAVAIPPEEIAAAEQQRKLVAIERIKQARGAALDKFTKQRSGVSTIYDENYIAATRYQAGDLTPLKNGMTPEVYLSGFGVKVGMTAAQFASYIITENRRLGPSAYEVEGKYLAAKVAASGVATATLAESIAAEYEAYCATVSGD